MENQPKVTIVVCIWNVEKTIHKAVDAILAQTYRNLEIILMDDESPDRCPQICEEYAKKDGRVIVLHKKDEGLAMARNFAMTRATGEYITFFDPDDWVELDGIENMVRTAVDYNADMVICDYFHNDQYRQTYAKQTPSALDHWSVLEDIATGKLFGYCWNKLIRLKLIQNIGATFPKGFYCDDQYMMCTLLKDDIKVSYLPKAYYHYVYGSASLSRRYDENSFSQDVIIRDAFYDLLLKTPSADSIYQSKTKSIFTRGYLFGKSVYTSKVFKIKFGDYKNLSLFENGDIVMKVLYKFALCGCYQLSRNIFALLFEIKQICKRMISWKERCLNL